MVKCLLSLSKSFNVKSYCQNLNVKNEKMVVLAHENLPSGQIFKMLYLSQR